MSFETWAMLIAGIALFLFGMMFFEETVHDAFGNSIKNFIHKYTSSLLKSIGVWITSTAILQSSTVVIMLMLWFVGANIINLHQGIGIVLWANIGTTLTPWMIALLWFKVNIEAITLPIIALGWVLLITGSRYPKLMTVAKFLFWFGLLFLGLSYMKESVDTLSTLFALDDASMWLFRSILLWIVITVILQTSTGTSVMTLAALSSGMITFDIALGMMIGANMWSAITTFLVWFLSSTGKYRTKRVIAMAHLVLNIYQMVVMLLLFMPVHRFLDVTGLSSDPVVGIAAYHTLYNVIGVSLFIPFVGLYVKFIQKKHFLDQEDPTVFAIDQVSTTMPEEYVVAMKKDILDFGDDIVKMIRALASHTHPDKLLSDTYATIKEDCEEWMTKVLQYDIKQANTVQQRQIEYYQLTVVDFLAAIKQLKDISWHYYHLRETDSTAIHKYMDQFDEKLLHLTDIMEYALVHKRDSSLQKIAQGEQVLLLDDARFLKDIKSSIANNNTDAENNHYRSQLLKTNRNVVISTRSIFDALISYHEQTDTLID